MTKNPNPEPEVESYFRPLGLFDEMPIKIIIAVIYLALVTVCFAVARQRDILQPKHPLSPPAVEVPVQPGPAEAPEEDY